MGPLTRLFSVPLLAIVLAGAAPASRSSVARFDWFEYNGDDHLPKPRPGEYSNPVLQGFYPDPSIVRVGRDYYLVNSTFGWFPGIPVFHSRDLVSWTQIGNAIDRPDQLNFGKLNLSNQGVYAPAISWHDSRFYIVNTCVGCRDNFVITAKNAAGPWSNPVFLPALNGGIDPSLFFDEDGSAWIVNNGPPPEKPRYDGHRAIWIQQFDPKTLKTLGPRKVLVDAGVHPEQDPIWIEGPHIFKRGGTYYLIAAEGGTAENHSEVVFRSERVNGPYVPFAGNPILTQRDLPKDRPRPITSTGHAEFVETPAGEWWAVFLGVRPYGDDQFNTGRETFLMPVKWRDGWPYITSPGERVPWTAKRPALPPQPKPSVPNSGAFTVRDNFHGAGLPPHWMMMRNPDGKWWRIAGGALELDARPVRLGDMDNPSLLARRQQHFNATATTRLSFAPTGDSEAGLVALQNDDFWYFLAVGREETKRVVRLRRRAGATEPQAGAILASAEVDESSPVDLRIAARGASYDFDWSTDGKRWHELLHGADGTVLSTKRAGGFVGAVFGLYAHQ
jgi:alpha-N-arabinofuranosidase